MEQERQAYQLRIQQLFMCTAIALPRYWQGVEDSLKLSHVLVGQRRGLAIFDNALSLGGAGNGNSALATYPPYGHLRHCGALALGNLLYRLDELEVLVEDVGLEARQHAAEVVLRDVVELADLARQPAAADRAVCHDGYANCVTSH